MNRNKILLLVPSINFARFRKRAIALYNLNQEVTVLAFERDQYTSLDYPMGYTSLGKLKNNKYIVRVFIYLLSIYKIFNYFKSQDVVYAFGFDVAMMAWVTRLFHYNKPKLVYEVADIRGIFLGESVFNKLMRSYERFLLSRISLLVVTSPTFIEGYYRNYLHYKGSIKYHVLENKLDKNQLPYYKGNPINLKKDTLVIGYFGVFRCRVAIETLRFLVEESKGYIKVYLRGTILEELRETFASISAIEGIQYDGSYVYPKDLPQVYNQVDIVLAQHLWGDENLLWARSNRFYESCCFQRPMIAQKDTEIANLIKELNIGFSVDLSRPEETMEEILTIDHHRKHEWLKNLENLPTSLYFYEDDHELLIKKLDVNDTL